MQQALRSKELASAQPIATIPRAGHASEPGSTSAAVQRLLAVADIRLNGDRPWDIHVNDPRFYRRVAIDGLLGFGESYVDGWWDCDCLDELFTRCHRADLPAKVPITRQAIIAWIRNAVFNLQKPGISRRNVDAHYQLGNDLFQAMLDPRMMYTCGYWKNASTLAQAQEAKLDLICRKLQLQPGQRVLDIGCGWGGFAKFAAERYGVSVLGVTLSSDQVQFGLEQCRGLPVEIRLQDYRQVNETFDVVVSIGCMEHVGPKNYRTFMQHAHRCLKTDGLCLLHFIACQHDMICLRDSDMLWINKYIFPGGVIPSVTRVSRAIENLFVLEDLHNFSSDYDPTLMAWFKNFDLAWPTLQQAYSPGFYRLWKYYLLSCAGTFRARKLQLQQWVLSKQGIAGGYNSTR